MPDYIIEQGDCVASIAYEHGLFWEKIWNHPKNAGLKEKRKDPNILCPGDVLFVPDKEEKQESAATDQKHSYKKKGVPEKLRIRLMAGKEAITNESYILDIDGELRKGKTDGDGNLEESIPPNAKKAKLWIGEDEESREIDLGHLDPVDEITGVQARLNNLGFYCGEVDGVKGPRTTAALKRFQKKHGFKETGEADQKTRNELKNAHIN